MSFLRLINGGDPKHLLTQMILQVPPLNKKPYTFTTPKNKIAPGSYGRTSHPGGWFP